MVFTAILGGLTALAGGYMSYQNMKRGKDMEEQAQEGIRDFTPQSLDSLQPSTLGTDIMTEQLGVDYATQVDALQGAGSRALVGGLGRVSAAKNLEQRKIAADLDRRGEAIDKYKVGLLEGRDNRELMGYGGLLNYGLGMQQTGQAGMVNAAGMLGQTVGDQNIDLSRDPRPMANTVGGVPSRGIAPLQTTGLNADIYNYTIPQWNG